MYDARRFLPFTLPLIATLLFACGSDATRQPEASPSPAVLGTPGPSQDIPDAPLDGLSAPNSASPGSPSRQDGIHQGEGGYLFFNQGWIEGMSSSGPDLDDVDAVFWYVFSRLPDQVLVYPTEHYYYYQLHVAGHRLHGNLRLSARDRDQGILHFNYFEFNLFPPGGRNSGGNSKAYGGQDGVEVTKLGESAYQVKYRDKAVTFKFNVLVQEPPKLFPLGEDEVFVERTFDESGFQFFLLFNEKGNYPFWVLNEEEEVPDVMDSIGDDLVAGEHSAFVFWVDKDHGDRKVLVGVWQGYVDRNTYYDGPFDQLADDYALESGISEYMQRAYPSQRGWLDEYGYFTYREGGARLALSTYLFYDDYADARRFMEEAKASDDPYRHISEAWRERNEERDP